MRNTQAVALTPSTSAVQWALVEEEKKSNRSLLSCLTNLSINLPRNLLDQKNIPVKALKRYDNNKIAVIDKLIVNKSIISRSCWFHAKKVDKNIH